MNYAPHEVMTDPARFSLSSTTVIGASGSCVAYHPAERRSSRATLFLHGAAGSWTTWTPLLTVAGELDLELGDTVLFDLPGWGGAQIDRDDPAPIDRLCTLVAEAAEQLGYSEWDLVGHSLGGFVALHLAGMRPENVLSVGMVSGTTFSVIHSVEHPVRRFAELPGFIMLWRVMQFLAALGPVGPAIVRGIERVGLLRLATFPLFRHWRRMPRSVTRALAIEVRPASFALAARATRGYDVAAHWGAIALPVRATKGDRDVFVTDRDFTDLVALIPGAECAVIEDCGHFGAIERPREVLEALGFTARR